MGHTVAIVVLWLFMISAGLLGGGSVFEHVVMTPLWAHAPPESVAAWPHGLVQRRFFMFVTPAYALLSFATIVASFAIPEAARWWALSASALGVVVLVWTAAYFLPILGRTQGSRGAGVAPAEIVRLVRGFVRWSKVRTALVLAGWLAVVRAITLAT